MKARVISQNGVSIENIRNFSPRAQTPLPFNNIKEEVKGSYEVGQAQIVSQ